MELYVTQYKDMVNEKRKPTNIASYRDENDWMCGVKLRDKLSSIELRQPLGIEVIVEVFQRNRLRWYRHVLRTDDDDWVKEKVCYFGG